MPWIILRHFYGDNACYNSGVYFLDTEILMKKFLYKALLSPMLLVINPMYFGQFGALEKSDLALEIWFLKNHDSNTPYEIHFV